MPKTPTKNTSARESRKPSARVRRAKIARPSASGAKTSVLAAAKALHAAIRSGNAAASEKFLARDFTFIDAAGHVHSRSSVLKSLKASPRGAGTHVKLYKYGRVAVLVGSYKSAQAAEQDDLHALDVWIDEGNAWKALIHHNNVLARPDTPVAHVSGVPRPMDAPPPRCINPLEVVPYKPKSRSEREIIQTFQTLERAVTRNDPAEWKKHVADEFVVTRTGEHPTDKASRIASMTLQKAINAETPVAKLFG